MSCVLVVDDDADIRGLVRELLERSGYDVLEAPDGNEGLKVFYAEQPDLVDPRRLDARARRLGRPRADPRAQRRSGGDADGARGGARQGARPARRRGRLRDQAVRPPGAAGQGGRRPSPQAQRRTGGRALCRRLRHDRLPAARGDRRRPPRLPDAARVPVADGLRAKPEPGPLARPAARPRVGRRRRRRARPGEAVRRLPAPQAELSRRSGLADRDDARVRLQRTGRASSASGKRTRTTVPVVLPALDLDAAAVRVRRSPS